MESNIEVLAPRLVAADSLYLSIINDRLYDLSNNVESISMALIAIKANHDTSKGMIITIKAMLLANSELINLVINMIGDVPLFTSGAITL